MYDHVRKVLSRRERHRIAEPGLTPAAVLVPLFARAGEPHVLLEQRTHTVDHHKGQISFPGGVQDPGDRDEVATALREASEEVGLPPTAVEVLGLMDDTLTVTGFRITPVVGRIPHPFEARLSDGEVARLLEIPWRVFAEGRTHRQERIEHEGQSFEVDFYTWDEHIIWGATARVIRQLVALTREPVEEEGA
ncbi:MAG TPA: CoA pyrophosphatase [Myxococcota bacterium]|nr:CoA pyrophosphatase [Myxococcota bacterium]HRY95305.1 CoA pyrophosphatase [Myxococcota bacterium]HSA21630.1 CoA pyrophosphatase [Myxococcota bacterium]